MQFCDAGKQGLAFAAEELPWKSHFFVQNIGYPILQIINKKENK